MVVGTIQNWCNKLQIHRDHHRDLYKKRDDRSIIESRKFDEEDATLFLRGAIEAKEYEAHSC
jgi:hypothetical protein